MADHPDPTNRPLDQYPFNPHPEHRSTSDVPFIAVDNPEGPRSMMPCRAIVGVAAMCAATLSGPRPASRLEGPHAGGIRTDIGP
jgi:hypothetical protein